MRILVNFLIFKRLAQITVHNRLQCYRGKLQAQAYVIFAIFAAQLHGRCCL